MNSPVHTSSGFDHPVRVLRLARNAASQNRPPGSDDKYKPVEDLVTVPVEWTYADPDEPDEILEKLPGHDVFVGTYLKPSMKQAAAGLKGGGRVGPGIGGRGRIVAHSECLRRRRGS